MFVKAIVTMSVLLPSRSNLDKCVETGKLRMQF